MAEKIDDEDLEVTPGYKAPEKKSLEEIMKADAEDESLRRYKEQLLGNAANLPKGSSGEPNVVVQSLTVEAEGLETPVTLDLTGDLCKLKDKPVVLKEGCSYSLKVGFKVNYEVVCGLIMITKLSRKGLALGTTKNMVGSYGPKVETQFFTGTKEDAPKGMLHRGDYKCKSLFTDDDKTKYLEWEWTLSIKKDWE